MANCETNVHLIGQPVDLTSRMNTIASIYVPEKVNRKRKNNQVEYTALSLEFKIKFNDIVKQQDSTAPVLCELQDTLNNIAEKYEYDACSDEGSDSAISSLDMELHPQTPEKSYSYKMPQTPEHTKPNNQLTQRIPVANNADNNETTEDDEDEESIVPHKQARREYDPQYPKVVWWAQKPVVMIGPNGTFVCAHEFDAMQWNSAAIATRCLLNVIFNNDELATHTLSGKPSPAFHGRERPTKMQLDPLKVADIIHCVVVKTGGKERDVRATITTKCADSAKLYKKRYERHLVN